MRFQDRYDGQDVSAWSGLLAVAGVTKIGAVGLRGDVGNHDLGFPLAYLEVPSWIGHQGRQISPGMSPLDVSSQVFSVRASKAL